MSDDLVTVVLTRDQLDALAAVASKQTIRALSDAYVHLLGAQLLDNKKRADA